MRISKHGTNPWAKRMNGQIVSSALLWLFSIAYLSQIRSLSIGNLKSPKEGFIPVVLGLLLLAVSSALIVNAWLASSFRKKNLVEGTGVRLGFHAKVGSAMAAMALFPLAVPYTTFELGLLAVTFWIAYIMGTRKRGAALLAASTAFVTYIVFRLWLQISLP